MEKVIEYYNTGDGDKLCALSYYPESDKFDKSAMIIASNYSIDMPIPCVRHIEYDNKKTDKTEFKQYFHAVKSFGKKIEKDTFDKLLLEWVANLSAEFHS